MIEIHRGATASQKLGNEPESTTGQSICDEGIRPTNLIGDPWCSKRGRQTTAQHHDRKASDVTGA